MNSRLCTSILFGLSVCLSGCAVMKGSNPLGRMMHQRDAVAGMDQDPFVNSPESSAAPGAGGAAASSAGQPPHAAGYPNGVQTATAIPPGTTIPHATPGVRQIGALPVAQPTASGSCTLTDGGPGIAGNSRFASRPAPLQPPANQPSGRVRLTGTAPHAPQGVVPVAWEVDAPATPPAVNSAAATAFPEVPQPLVAESARRITATAPPELPVASTATRQPQRLTRTASVAAPFPGMDSTATPLTRAETETAPRPLPRAATTGTAAPFPETAVAEATASAAADAAPAARTPRKPRARSTVQPTALLERTNAPVSVKPTGTVSKRHRPASPRLLGRAAAADTPAEAAPGGNPFEPADAATDSAAPAGAATDENWKPAGSITRTSDSTGYWPAPVPADAPAN